MHMGRLHITDVRRDKMCEIQRSPRGAYIKESEGGSRPDILNQNGTRT